MDTVAGAAAKTITQGSALEPVPVTVAEMLGMALASAAWISAGSAL